MKKKELDKLKVVELEIMDDFVSFCNKNNLKYYLTYGTLLGAVRHKGFIPWDDDIDVCMPPNDYLKFIKLFRNDKYFLQNVKTEKFYHAIFSKIRKNNTCMIEEDWKYIKIHKGINIDVFPMIPIPNKKNLNVMFKLKIKIMLLLLSKNNKTKLLKNKIIFKILKFIPRNISNKIEIKILDNMLLFNKEFDYYTIDGDMNYQFNRKWFNSSKLVQFEDRKYVIPSSYDAILKMCYNDYMKLPPKEERIGNGNIILIFDKNYEELKK